MKLKRAPHQFGRFEEAKTRTPQFGTFGRAKTRTPLKLAKSATLRGAFNANSLVGIIMWPECSSFPVKVTDLPKISQNFLGKPQNSTKIPNETY